METQNNIKHPPPVPPEYLGKWIAWNRYQTRIVASGQTVTEAIAAAKQAGEPNPILAKVPRTEHFVGAGL